MPRRRVEVLVRDADGHALADQRVILEPVDHPRLAWPWRYGRRADAEGRITFDPAPPGRLRVRAFAPGQDMRVETPALVLGELSAEGGSLEVRLPR